MIIYTSHRELQEAIDKTVIAYGTHTADRMRNLTYEHLTKLLQIQADLMQTMINPAKAK